jgi:hypothetical protein
LRCNNNSSFTEGILFNRTIIDERKREEVI